MSDLIVKHDKYYNFVGDIYDEKVNPLIDFINLNPGTIFLSIDSGGGSMALMRILGHILHENRDRISLCATEAVYSSAFELFYRFSGQRFITKNTMGMYHYANRKITILDNNTPAYREDMDVKKDLPFTQADVLTFCGEFMTKKELKTLKAGLSVFFTFKRMKEIFPSVKII